MAARTLIPIQDLVRAGLTPTYTSVTSTAGGYFQNDGTVFLRIVNTAVDPATVTIPTSKTIDSLALADLTMTVAATTGEKITDFFPIDTYNQTGNVVYVDTTVTVTIAAFKHG